MTLDKNVGESDRLYRSIFGIIFLIIAEFWTSSVSRIIFYILSFILLFSAFLRFCLIYKILNITTWIKAKEQANTQKSKWFFVIIVSVLLAGSIASYFITKKIFLSDFNNLEKDYKTLLLSTSQENRGESIADYNSLEISYSSFQEKYSTYRPWFLRNDEEFDLDLKEIKEAVEGSKHKINYGNISAAYTSLESIRPIINNIRIRNNLESNKIAFSEFYGPMEILIDSAKSGDLQEVERAYQIADEKLKYIESFMNNSEVALIRLNLDNVYNLVKKKEFDKIPARTTELKSSYLKVYLRAG